MEELTNPGNWGVVIATLGLVAIAVGLHYEVLRSSVLFMPALAQKRRQRVVVLIFAILLTHAVETWIFGIGYYGLLKHEMFGDISGTAQIETLLDHVYYSATVYTTVGFGDLVPEGPIRFMTGMEALTGLVLITWSASFTFLEMQRDWPATRG